MFHSGDLQSGVGLALQQHKAVLCFIHDDSQQSTDWENILTSGSFATTTLTAQAVMLKIQARSQEAAFLGPFCPINSAPAIIVIKNAAVQANLQANDIDTAQIQPRLESLFGTSNDDSTNSVSSTAVHEETQAQAARTTEQSASSTSAPSSTSASASTSTVYLALAPSDGQFRLPNNAYDALREHTQHLLDQDTPHKDIYETQLRILDRLPILRDEVRRLRSVTANPTLSEYARDKLLRMPGAAVKAQAKVEAAAVSSAPGVATPSSSQSPPSSAPGGQNLVNASTRSSRGGEYVYIQPDSNQPLSETEEQARVKAETAKKRAERAEWNRQQRERQQKDREARENIKAEIAADREERRRLAELRQNSRTTDPETDAETKRAKPQFQAEAGIIRVQVRSFDGGVFRGSFKHDSTIAGEIRPFVDEKTSGNVPYTLKLILTPLPNRNIEAAEEDLPLSDFGIKGSCTFVMVPVRGYVDSYSDSSPGLVRNVLGLGYGLASGAAETVWGVGRYVLGYNSTTQPQAANQTPEGTTANAGDQQQTGSTNNANTVRVRTLADQRAEEKRKREASGQLYNGNQLNFEPNRDESEDSSKRD